MLHTLQKLRRTIEMKCYLQVPPRINREREILQVLLKVSRKNVPKTKLQNFVLLPQSPVSKLSNPLLIIKAEFIIIIIRWHVLLAKILASYLVQRPVIYLVKRDMEG